MINFYNNEIFCLGKAKDDKHEYKQLFDCESSYLPIRYIQVPNNYKSFGIRNGIQLRIDLNGNSKVVKGNCSQMEIDLFLLILY